jgi:hypothetical protein
MPIQSERVVGVAPESVFGSFVAPTLFVPCIAKPNSNLAVTRPEQSIGFRGQRTDVPVKFETEVTLTGPLIPVVWSNLAAYAFGKGSDGYTSVAGAAHHLLTPQPQCPSCSVELDDDIIPGEQVLARQFSGGIVDRFQIKATNQTLIEAEAQLILQKEATPATPGAPSPGDLLPTYSTIQPFDFSTLAFSYKGQSNTELKDTTIALLNKVVRVFSSNGLLTAARLVPTRREVTLTTNLDFLSTVFYNDWIAAKNEKLTSGIVITMTTAALIPTTAVPYSVKFTIPGLRPMGVWDDPAASDVFEQSMTFSATVQGANEISAEFVNEQTGALA